VPADQRESIVNKYEGTQFRVEHPINVYYFWMNTTRAPFDDPKVREAVNYAVNTAALEKIYAGSMAATHQVLPEGMPGHEPIDLYPYNMGKAEALLKEANPSDRNITVWTDNENPNNEAGAYYQDVLTKLGFNAKLKTINADNYFTILGNESTPDLGRRIECIRLDNAHVHGAVLHNITSCNEEGRTNDCRPATSTELQLILKGSIQ